jgi:hypothetical protein
MSTRSFNKKSKFENPTSTPLQQLFFQAMGYTFIIYALTCKEDQLLLLMFPQFVQNDFKIDMLNVAHDFSSKIFMHKFITWNISAKTHVRN